MTHSFSIAQKLTHIMGAVFAALDLPPELGVVRVSDRPDLAQFQCNGAMPAAKSAGKNPREIAQAIVAFLNEINTDPARMRALVPDTDLPAQDFQYFTGLEIAGPGFININITDQMVAYAINAMAKSEVNINDNIGQKRTIVLDYGGPNIAKAMHVGHLRSSIIGDSLRRICLAGGYNAIGDVHMGDWGTPMGQIISELERRHPQWPYFDAEYTGEYPKNSPVGMEDLEKIYPEASAACKADEARAESARLATADLQNGRRGYRALWQHFVDISVNGMKKNFDALGVTFDLWKGEASVHDLIAPMVESLRGKNLAVDSDGAVVVPVARADDKKEIPPLILYKSDGAVMYGTTDLATIVDRVQAYKPEKILYVVDQRQSLHFEQVFRAARLSGIAPEASVELTHAGFGTMNGTDGKPFKTRAGGVMKLEDLIAMGVEKAQARLNEAELATDMDDTERSDIATKVAIAAIKFADLQNNRIADYVFDIDRMMAFEGKTGPYLLYQAVRIKSLLRKAQSAAPLSNAADIIITDDDKPLALLLTELPDYFETALRHYTPHVLCDYAFKLSQEFSRFYAACHILSEENPQLRHSRLLLCGLTYRHLAFVLELLGIEIPDRM